MLAGSPPAPFASAILRVPAVAVGRGFRLCCSPARPPARKRGRGSSAAEPRHKATSHRIYRTPWPGDPRVNVQNAKGKAKPYQVRQVIKAIEKLEGTE